MILANLKGVLKLSDTGCVCWTGMLKMGMCMSGCSLINNCSCRRKICFLTTPKLDLLIAYCIQCARSSLFSFWFWLYFFCHLMTNLITQVRVWETTPQRSKERLVMSLMTSSMKTACLLLAFLFLSWTDTSDVCLATASTLLQLRTEHSCQN